MWILSEQLISHLSPPRQGLTGRRFTLVRVHLGARPFLDTNDPTVSAQRAEKLP